MSLFYSNPMNKPGILLTGKNAGDWYLQTLKRYSGNSAEACYIVQADFEPINALLPYKMKEAAKLIEPYFRQLEKRNQAYILANITLHEALNYFSFVPNYFISIKEILKNISHKGGVIILGTQFTMNHSYIPSLLPQGLEQMPLSHELQTAVDALRKKYYNTKDKVMAEQVFQSIKNIAADYVLIACTELAVAYGDVDCSLNIINLPQLQIEQLLKQENDE